MDKKIAGLLGAVAAARAVGVGAREIRSALIAFNSVVPEAAQQTLARIALI